MSYYWSTLSDSKKYILYYGISDPEYDFSLLNPKLNGQLKEILQKVKANEVDNFAKKIIEFYNQNGRLPSLNVSEEKDLFDFVNAFKLYLKTE